MFRILLVVILLFVLKVGRSINKFDISENIGHSHKQTKNIRKGD